MTRCSYTADCSHPLSSVISPHPTSSTVRICRFVSCWPKRRLISQGNVCILPQGRLTHSMQSSKSVLRSTVHIYSDPQECCFKEAWVFSTYPYLLFILNVFFFFISISDTTDHVFRFKIQTVYSPRHH